MGASIMLAAYAAARQAALEVLTTGTYDSFPDLGTARAAMMGHR